jgi:hypothetical protein
MPEITRSLLAFGGALLLFATLISCGSPAGQPTSETLDISPSISTSIQALPAGKPREEALESASSTPAATPLTADEHPPSSATAVEASTMEPNPNKRVITPEAAFQPQSPTLGGIGLGASEKDVFEQFGHPLDTYPLPGGAQTVEIWEYNGFSIGLNSHEQVVYVEITSADVRTGIHGLANGMNGTEAAKLLGLTNNDQSYVLALEVTGGSFRLDLDPETQNVLSLKLLSKDI